MRHPLLLGLALLLATPCLADGLSREQAEAIVSAADRSEADRELDARRHPVELLLFSGVAPGQTVADLGAGAGYTTELLARAVGPKGRVYGHNTPTVIEKYVSETWPARLARPANARVVRVDAPLGAPLPDEVTGLDLITMVFVYHDALFGVEDRAKMNARLLAALAPGGRLVVVDHHAKAGSGPKSGKALHRIDEALLRRELEAAGFRFDASADFLRNPDDPREKPFFEMEGPTDAFVHRYVKPE